MSHKLLAALADEIRTSMAAPDAKMFAAMCVIRSANTLAERLDRQWFLTLCGL